VYGWRVLLISRSHGSFRARDPVPHFAYTDGALACLVCFISFTDILDNNTGVHSPNELDYALGVLDICVGVMFLDRISIRLSTQATLSMLFNPICTSGRHHLLVKTAPLLGRVRVL
jgi:hypothetical protein